MCIRLCHNVRVTQRLAPDLACVAVVGVQVAVVCEGQDYNEKRVRVDEWMYRIPAPRVDGSQLLGVLARSPDLPIRSQSSAITLSHVIGTHHLATWLHSY